MTDIDYEALANSYEPHDILPGSISTATVQPDLHERRREQFLDALTVSDPTSAARLRRGRPSSHANGHGESPARSIRFPVQLDQALAALAKQDGTSVSEQVRLAVAAYVDARPLN